jgi:TPP-dependent pyruvate/acetoin dehydrogenase alpha subunit
LFEFWEERDPISKFERFLKERGIITAAGIEDLQKRINREIDEAIQIAEKDPFPEPEDCLKDVYYEGE